MLTIAHRGDKLAATENSLAAFKSAIDKKADMIELDVQMTKDGQLVVIHDPTIDRTTNGRGLVREMTLAEIQQFKTKEGESIPTLEEVYQLCRNKIQVLTEIKAVDLAPKIAELVKTLGNTDEVIIQSFLHGELIDYRRCDTRTRIAALFDEILLDGETISKYLDKLKAQGAAMKYAAITDEVLNGMKKHDKFLYAWGMTEKQLTEAKKSTLDGLITALP
jgi:glycerophosphoryl diester phosphodiesterase